MTFCSQLSFKIETIFWLLSWLFDRSNHKPVVGVQLISETCRKEFLYSLHQHSLVVLGPCIEWNIFQSLWWKTDSQINIFIIKLWKQAVIIQNKSFLNRRRKTKKYIKEIYLPKWKNLKHLFPTRTDSSKI